VLSGEFRSGANLAAAFADLYAKKNETKVGLIPCADGGTSIAQWQPGEPLYDNAVFCAKMAMRSSNLRAILFHQGESECHSEELVGRYGEMLLRVINGMRAELGAPDLPFIAGEISEEIREERWGVSRALSRRFNENLRALVGKIPRFAVVSAKGLTLKPDGIHFDTPSLRKMGGLYLSAYEALSSK
jgi:hypothetical protein